MDLPNPHGALLTLDVAALVENWRRLAARARPAECSAVVKANAYGLGIEVVVAALARAGCRCFFVAHLEEAARARKAAPMAVVYVLNGLPVGSEPIYHSYRVRPVLGTVAEIGRWKKSGGGPCAMHVDTGMHRLGLSMDEAKALSMLNEWEGLGIELLMSHFVASEEPDAPSNAEQAQRFELASSWFGDRIKRRSLANSSGHFLPIPTNYDLTRPGYALYGGNPTPGRPNPMLPVVRLEALILQIRHLEPGETVGYNAAWTARRPSRIATLSVGYADGWLRSLSGDGEHRGGQVLVEGHRCPIVGRISMDLMSVDVTDVPLTAVRAGQRAVLIGDGLTIEDVAAAAGTNGYEILTSLGRRSQRKLAGV
jgi:alanine racemase